MRPMLVRRYMIQALLEVVQGQMIQDRQKKSRMNTGLCKALGVIVITSFNHFIRKVISRIVRSKKRAISFRSKNLLIQVTDLP